MTALQNRVASNDSDPVPQTAVLVPQRSNLAGVHGSPLGASVGPSQILQHLQSLRQRSTTVQAVRPRRRRERERLLDDFRHSTVVL